MPVCIAVGTTFHFLVMLLTNLSLGGPEKAVCLISSARKIEQDHSFSVVLVVSQEEKHRLG